MTTVVNYNPSAQIALNALGRSSKSLGQSIERLSTGLRINRASDGPAALVISERLRSQIAGLRQAVDNSERAQNVISTAEAALIEVNDLLISMQNLIVEAQNPLATEEVLANQAQIDDALQTIDKIGITTNFAGLGLLDGSTEYVLSGLNSGVASGIAITDIDVQGANIVNGPTTITTSITQNASQAILLTSNAVTASGASLVLTGSLGTAFLQFSTAQTQSAVAAAVNAVSDSTGIVAATSGTVNTFTSVGFGSAEAITVKDTFKLDPTSQYINGYDVGSDIVGTVNGISGAGEGLTLIIESDNFDANITFDSNFYLNNSAAGVATTTFNTVAGGLNFQLGSSTNASERAQIGIGRVGTDNLGSIAAGGFLSDLATGGIATLTTNAALAHQITQEAIDSVTEIRARLGAFQANRLESNINSLNVAIENTAAAESRIRDADFAVETANFTRSQVLQQAGTAILAQANSLTQSALALLG